MGLYLFFLKIFFCFVFFPFISTKVPVYVMLPLNIIKSDGTFVNEGKLWADMRTLVRNSKIDGFAVDCWWGIIERVPRNYDFRAYLAILEVAHQEHVKVAVVTSFHRCGGNVGDDCNINLPGWIISNNNSNPDIFYTDKHLNRNPEYLSLGVDNEKISDNRTPLEMYRNFFIAMKNSFQKYIDLGVLSTIAIGLGPAGELRYPSYPLQRWTFPGIGEFQCYDRYMLKALYESAQRIGRPDWGHPPDNSGSYNDLPHQAPFFQLDFKEPYGKFFLSFYSQQLAEHARRVFQEARKVFPMGSNPKLAGKIAGIHWNYNTESHASELTAGYYHLWNQNGYQTLARVFKEYDIKLDFTCLEMRNSEQPGNCACAPEDLVHFSRETVWNEYVKYGGENALPTGNDAGYDMIVKQSSVMGKKIDSFTYLRMFDWLFQTENLRRFTNFVQKMHNL